MTEVTSFRTAEHCEDREARPSGQVGRDVLVRPWQGHDDGGRAADGGMSRNLKTERKGGDWMIVLMGGSGSGKSAAQKKLEEMGISKVVTCTTRPPRADEEDGVDYRFLAEEEFAEMADAGAFAEHATYRGWRYGTPKDACGMPDTSAALTPAGFRALRRAGIPCVGFFIDVDRPTRMAALLRRGDDVDEAYRRNLTDVGQFDELAKEADHVIENRRFSLSPQVVAEAIAAVYDDEKEALYE